jgi:predicted GIY-YIG superfamily endonuclease
MGKLKWTKDVCFEEAKKYTSRYEFQLKCCGAYTASLHKGWLDNYTWFTSKQKPSGYWNYETCLEEAKKYTTRRDYRRNSGGAYGVSLKNGWLGDYTWFISKRIEWTKERCMLEAKKYHTRGGFRNGCQSAYNKARQNNWLHEYTWLSCKNTAPKGYWNYETCYDEAKKYETRVEFGKNSNTAYKKALLNGWLDDYTWLRKRYSDSSKVHCVYAYEDRKNRVVYVGLSNDFKRRDRQHRRGRLIHGELEYDSVYNYFNETNQVIPAAIILEDKLTGEEASLKEGYYANYYVKKGWSLINKTKTGSLGGYIIKWTKDACINESKKYKSRYEFSEKSSGAYSVSLEKGWLDEFYWLVPQRRENGYWTYDRCYQEAKKCVSHTDFQQKSPSARCAALRNGWIKDYTWFKKKISPYVYWTFDRCLEEAKKYKTKNDFRINSYDAYRVSLKEKWMKEFSWLESPIIPRGYWTFDVCLEEARKYGNVYRLKSKCYGAYNKITKKKWTREINNILAKEKDNEVSSDVVLCIA